MKKKATNNIILKPLFHKNENWIGIYFDYDIAIVNLIKTIKNRKYSKSNNCWYIPYTKEAFQDFKNLNISFQTLFSSGTTDSTISNSVHTGIAQPSKLANTVMPVNSTKKATDIQQVNNNKVLAGPTDITWNNQNFYVKIRSSKPDIDYLKAIKGTWWNANHKVWVVRSSSENLFLLQKHFCFWSKEEYEKLMELIKTLSEPQHLTLYISPELPDKLIIKLFGYKTDFSFLKNLPERSYDQAKKRWILPYDAALVKRIKEHYEGQGVKIVDRLPSATINYQKIKPSLSDKQKHLLSKISNQYHPIIIQYTDTLIAQRYSWSTIKSYTGEFTKYLINLNGKNPREATPADANNYLAKRGSQKISESLMNTIVSAIKFYYHKVVFITNFNIDQIKRPRKSRTLPTILSQNEVDKLLRSCENLKHLTILYALYGSGLRLNELLSLKVNDIYWDRNQIFVKNGKGKKDRVVMLGASQKELMSSYFDQYQPIYWMFEGQDKQKQYSGKSVQNIVSNAAKKAGITRKVTPHTLRHCFATHLMDSGIQIPYIQELLGHKDIKTTMIYTHVTTGNITSIKSPLDKLNQKE